LILKNALQLTPTSIDVVKEFLSYFKELNEMPDVKQLVNLDHRKRHYYMNHEIISPSRVITLGKKRRKSYDV
tara:strand:- start:288 stop:503 length:216 start_codon:yes stop_codon:yes gene_type:complete